jgi:diguanylate cyclase (GGDEF)-like protein
MEIALRDTSWPTALALVDVDRFKSINDSHGHAIGDAVLAEIARRLKTGMREDDVVARLGGDEFAILFRCDLETAKVACERIARAIAGEPMRLKGGCLVHASISCGVAGLRSGGSRDQLGTSKNPGQLA